jgi:DNA mismatch endonuclease, patch repair protein
MGLRYRLNVKSLPGSPDLANKTKRWAIFVNGCFWHGHKNCRLASTPKRNQGFWLSKFADNRARDARKIKELRKLGFRAAIVWQCEAADREALARRLQSWAKRVS